MANQVIFRAERCKGCELCTLVCPKKIVVMSKTINEKGYHPAECSDVSQCIACAFCARMCPDSVITVVKGE